jgi:alpha 1,3-glucosidase
MNEPSVFSTVHRTLPLDSLHYKTSGKAVAHREIHNAYGALQMRASYKGLQQRDRNTLRPFVLTRSWFLGSQKFGAYWTGDNHGVDGEIGGSMKMIL